MYGIKKRKNMIINKSGNKFLERKVRGALIRLLKNDPVFGYFLMSTQIIIKKEDFPTIFTNGKYGPTDSLPDMIFY